MYSQIKTLSQTGVADISLADLEILQSYHSLQTLHFAQQKILSSKFHATESIEQVKSRTLEKYLQIIEKATLQLQAQSELLRDSNDESKRPFSIVKDILCKIVASDNFSQHVLSQQMGPVFEKEAPNDSSVASIKRLLAAGLNKELILSSE